MTEKFVLRRDDRGDSFEIGIQDLLALPGGVIPAAVMTGDCEGFSGVYRFDGPALQTLLESIGAEGCPPAYNRYVLVESGDGFCAVFSFGELFNSRLSGNIILAIKRDGALLGEQDGFSRTVVGEDSTGGRSVKRISAISVITVD